MLSLLNVVIAQEFEGWNCLLMIQTPTQYDLDYS
jgi:hypothetical protein